jgi:HKD family nuclease
MIIKDDVNLHKLRSIHEPNALASLRDFVKDCQVRESLDTLHSNALGNLSFEKDAWQLYYINSSELSSRALS